MTEIPHLTSDELLEKRRLTLLSRTRHARIQLDSLSLLDTSYEQCRQNLRQWRCQIIEQINKAHETSLAELNNAYEQLNRFRSTIDNLLNEQQTSSQSSTIESSLNNLRQADFSFDFHQARQLDGQLQLLKLSNSQQQRQSHFLNKSNTNCRLLIPQDRYVSDIFFYDDLIQRIDCQTNECILVCPLDLLDELLGYDQDIRILIDQTYLPMIGTQAQRMRIDYELNLLQPAQECCPLSTERVIRIICQQKKNLLACLEEIYTICSQQSSPDTSNQYNPINYNKSKVHLYGGYSDNNFSQTSDLNKTNNSIFSSLQVTNSNVSSQQHFDRVLMPVSIHQTIPITDMQAGALLGPKGERIQQLQRETGAIVTIADLNDDANERRRRIVNIQGSQQQVNNALQAIKKLLMITNNDEDNQDGNQK